MVHSSTPTSRLERPLYNHRMSHSSSFEQNNNRIMVREKQTLYPQSLSFTCYVQRMMDNINMTVKIALKAQSLFFARIDLSWIPTRGLHFVFNWSKCFTAMLTTLMILKKSFTASENINFDVVRRWSLYYNNCQLGVYS